ncbi:MAG: hypothetical protein AABW89_02760 [Nanoarchaeota archaeon]
MARRLWFKAKRYGYGWYPCTWQGCLILAVYVLLVLLVFVATDIRSNSVSDTLIGIFVPFVILSLVLIFICYKTGEKPRWRWGK